MQQRPWQPQGQLPLKQRLRPVQVLAAVNVQQLEGLLHSHIISFEKAVLGSAIADQEHSSALIKSPLRQQIEIRATGFILPNAAADWLRWSNAQFCTAFTQERRLTREPKSLRS